MKLIFSFALAAVIIFSAFPAVAATPDVHLFGALSCDLCQEAASYLQAVARREGAGFFYHDLEASTDNVRLMRAVAADLGVKADGTPLIVVGRRAHVGWSRETVGPMVEDDLVVARAAGSEDAVADAAAALAAGPAPATSSGGNRAGLLAILLAGLLAGAAGFALLRRPPSRSL